MNYENSRDLLAEQIHCHHFTLKRREVKDELNHEDLENPAHRGKKNFFRFQDFSDFGNNNL